MKLTISQAELKKRTSKDYFKSIELISEKSECYKQLDKNDKECLKHLIRAAKYFDLVHLQLDNHFNIDAIEYFQDHKDAKSKMAKRVFDGMKGLEGVDGVSAKVKLFDTPDNAQGFYPLGLTKQKFHKILLEMFKNGEIDEIKRILSQRTVVHLTDNKLVSVDYVYEFNEEFEEAAQELKEAAKYSTNKEFANYLILQSKALTEADPELDYEADKAWAELQDTPLEFTITREAYADELTPTVFENKELKALIEQHEIEVNPKDSIGCRVGIVNKDGTDFLLNYKAVLPELAKQIPMSDRYEQTIKEDVKQTMVDVDLAYLAGDCGTYRGSITLAENLPNDDKLSVKRDGGRRNVYHRQIRISNPKRVQKFNNLILDKDLHKYHTDLGSHLFTIGHENAHSLGPTDVNLGNYGSIVEENKADMASLAMVNYLVEKGLYTEEQKKEIVVSAVLENFMRAKPLMSQAHRVRNVMQNNWLEVNKAYTIKKGKIHIDIEKTIEAAKSMLDKIIEVQLSNDIKKAKKFVDENFKWTSNMKYVSKQLCKVSKTLNGYLVCPLANSK